MLIQQYAEFIQYVKAKHSGEYSFAQLNKFYVEIKIIHVGHGLGSGICSAPPPPHCSYYNNW